MSTSRTRREQRRGIDERIYARQSTRRSDTSRKDDRHWEHSHVPFLPAVTGKLKAPVQRTEEGEHDGAVGHLDVERVVEHRDRDAGVDVGSQACRGDPSLTCEVHRCACRADVGKATCEAEHDVGLGYGGCDRVGDAQLWTRI